MKIGKYSFNSDLIMPAVAGYTDVGFRVLCKRYGAALAFTEMVSAKGLLYGGKTAELLYTHKEEDIKCVQIFGREPDIMAKAINLKEMQKFDIIDINFGCPVPKIVNNGEGSALLKEPELIHSIVKECKKAAGEREITAKIRIGFNSVCINAKEVAKAIEDGGASAIIVHGRTREMMYSGKADLDAIKSVKDSVNIPVIGNGDVTNRDEYLNMLRVTNADGVAVARGALGRPFVFSTLRGIEVNYDLKSLIKEHIDMLLEHLPAQTVFNNIKKHAAFYLKNQKGSKANRQKALLATSLPELLDCFE